jgi:hypothetical protein
MANPAGEADRAALKLDFDRRLILQFRGSAITSDAGLLPYRELDDALGLTDTGADTLADARTGKNGRHRLAGLLRQSVFGRLAGYEDVNDADRLSRDPAMRWVVGDQAITGSAASASQMGRFETKWLVRPENLAALADLPGQWIDAVHQRRPPRTVVLDMDSSESPTYGEQEGSAYNGHFGCSGTCEQYIKEGKNAIKWTRLSCRTFAANAVRLQLHALAYNLGNFMRTLAMPKTAEPWSLTSLREKLIKIGAEVVSHGRYVTFQMAEVAVPRQMFKEILMLIARLRPPPAPA